MVIRKQKSKVERALLKLEESKVWPVIKRKSTRKWQKVSNEAKVKYPAEPHSHKHHRFMMIRRPLAAGRK